MCFLNTCAAGAHFAPLSVFRLLLTVAASNGTGMFAAGIPPAFPGTFTCLPFRQNLTPFRRRLRRLPQPACAAPCHRRQVRRWIAPSPRPPATFFALSARGSLALHVIVHCCGRKILPSITTASVPTGNSDFLPDNFAFVQLLPRCRNITAPARTSTSVQRSIRLQAGVKISPTDS